MIQLIAHLWGDYLTQSDWMASGKTKSTFEAFIHATLYAIPFYWLGSASALFVIWATHFLIDRFRLARYLVFAKEFLSPRSNWPTWEDSKGTGYPSSKPAWLAVWLMIAADNTLHLTINYFAIKYL